MIHNQFSHHHVVKLYHVTGGTKLGGGPKQIVLEFCEGGDLIGGLREGRLDWQDILRALIDVCDGMAYLAEIGFVHRDLAARNIFIKNGQAKVGDFGMSKKIEVNEEPLPKDDAAATSTASSASHGEDGAPIAPSWAPSNRAAVIAEASEPAVVPLRWTAPEALLYREWSDKSDVWSFGILMYEAFTAGAPPYMGMKNTDLSRVSSRL